MVIKNYSVTLDDRIVERAKSKLRVGQKLSPVINNLLKQWSNNEMEIEEEDSLDGKTEA